MFIFIIITNIIFHHLCNCECDQDIIVRESPWSSVTPSSHAHIGMRLTRELADRVRFPAKTHAFICGSHFHCDAQGVLPCKWWVVTASQFNLSPLTPSIVAGYGRLPPGVAHCGYFSSLTLIDHSQRGSRFSSGGSFPYYYYYLKRSAVQGWESVIYTLSVRRPQPHNTNL